MDTSWIWDITLFDTPILRYFFDVHLAQTIVVLLLVFGFLSNLISKIRSGFRDRRVPLALREKLLAASEIYINPDYSYTDPAHQPEPGMVEGRSKRLLTHIERFISTKSPKSRCMVLADSGMGKSALLFNLLNRHLRRRSSVYEVVLIELGYRDVLGKISDIRKPEDTVLLLDALDENLEAINGIESFAKKLTEATQPFYRVVISCRTQFFCRIEEVPSFLANVGGVTSAGDYQRGLLEKVFICPFTETQIELFLVRKYLLGLRDFSIPKYVKARATYKNVPNVAVRPMLLTYIDYLIQVDLDIKYSFGIYEAMIYGWLRRRKSEELDPSFRDNLKFVFYIAIEMAKGYSCKEAYFVDADEAERLAIKLNASLTNWQISDRSLLNQDVLGRYKFAHLSIMEALLARAKLKGVDLGDWRATPLTKRFIQDLVDSSQSSTLGEAIQPKSYISLEIRNEFRMLGVRPARESDYEKSKSHDTPRQGITEKSAANERIEEGDDNGATDYSFCNISEKHFNGKEFRGHLFRGAICSRSKFIDCDLSEADFTGASLNQAVFERCKLDGAFFLGAEITSAVFVLCDAVNTDFSMVRIKESTDGGSYPQFVDSILTDALLPNDYAKYFLDAPASGVKRDSEDVQIL